MTNRCIILFLASILLLTATAVSFAPQATSLEKKSQQAESKDSEARSLARKIVDSYGGIERIKNFNATAYRATGKLEQVSSISGSRNIFDCTVTIQGARQVVEVRFMGQLVTTGYDGQMCWTSQGGLVMPTDKITARRVKEDVDHGLLLLERLLDPGRKIRLGSQRRVQGKRCLSLIVTADDGKDTEFLVDKKTFLVLRSEYPGIDIEQGVECTKAYEYKDYRSVDGTMQPFTSIEFSDSKKVGEVTIKKIKTGVKLSTNYFSMPDKSRIARLKKGPVRVPVNYVGNEIIARLKVNGEKEIKFLVDTGATQTIIDFKTARALGAIKSEELSITTGSGAMKMKYMTLDSLRLGDLVLDDIPVAIADLKQFTRALQSRPSGLLGANVLKRFQLTIDYDANEIILSDPDKPIEKSTSKSSSDVIVDTKPTLGISGIAVEGTLDEKLKLTFLLDTGAAFNHVNERLIKDIVEEPILPVGVIKGLDGKAVHTGALKFSTLKIGDLVIDNPVFSVAPSKSNSDPGLITGGNIAILGNPLLSKYRVTIDYRNQKVRLSTTRKKAWRAKRLARLDHILKEYYVRDDVEQTLSDLAEFVDRSIEKKEFASAAIAQAYLSLFSSRSQRAPGSREVANEFNEACALAEKSADGKVAAQVFALWAQHFLSSKKPADYIRYAQALIGRALKNSSSEPSAYLSAGILLIDGKGKLPLAANAKPPKAMQLIDQALMLDPSNWSALWQKYSLAEAQSDAELMTTVRQHLNRYYPGAKRLLDLNRQESEKRGG